MLAAAFMFFSLLIMITFADAMPFSCFRCFRRRFDIDTLLFFDAMMTGYFLFAFL